MTHFRIISGTPGMDKSRIAQRLYAYISGEDQDSGTGPGAAAGRARLEGLRVGGRPPSVTVQTVEDFIKREDIRKDLYSPDPGTNSLFDILSQLPQDYVRELWQGAFRQAAEESLAKSPDLAILITSLTYYRSQTYEFYCTPDLRFMADWKSRQRGIQSFGPILTLMDDVYDLYYRLSKPGEVFDIQQLVNLELEANRGSERARYQKALTLVIQCLIRLLEWRESDIQAAAALGSVWGESSVVLAIKGPRTNNLDNFC